MLRFDDIFIDCTRLGRKISKEKYLQKGKHIIIDQGQNDIAGYLSLIHISEPTRPGS